MLQLSDSQAVVGLEIDEGGINGSLGQIQWEHGSWRLDAGPNRTSFNRQLSALVSLCTTLHPPPMLKLLVGGSLEHIAEWATRERDGLDVSDKGDCRDVSPADGTGRDEPTTLVGEATAALAAAADATNADAAPGGATAPADAMSHVKQPDERLGAGEIVVQQPEERKQELQLTAHVNHAETSPDRVQSLAAERLPGTYMSYIYIWMP